MKEWEALIARLQLRRGLAGRPDIVAPIERPEDPDAVQRRLSQMLHGVDVERENMTATGLRSEEDLGRPPAGVRMARIALGAGVQALCAAGDPAVPAGLFRLPDSRGAIVRFLAKRAGFADRSGSVDVSNDVEASLARFYGFRIGDVADDLLALRASDPKSFALLFSLEFELALVRRPALAAADPRYPRLRRGLLDALLILAELERLRTILGNLAGRLLGSGRKTVRTKPLNSNALLRMLTGGDIALGGSGDHVVAHLQDALLHVETLLWCMDNGPPSIDPLHPLLALFTDGDAVRDALRHPQGRVKLAGRLRAARHSRPDRAGKVMPVGAALFMGMNLLDTATVGLIEIGLGVAPVGNERIPIADRVTPEAAFWCLFLTMLRDVDASLPDLAVGSSRRGPAKSKVGLAGAEFGEARMRRAKGPGGFLRVYLPPAGEAAGAGRFVPDLWLAGDRDVSFWIGVVRGYRQNAYGGLFDALPAEWKPALLARASVLRRTMGAIQAKVAADGDHDVGLTAETLAALFTATMPLTSDPLLLHVLRKQASSIRGGWWANRAAAYREIGAEQVARGDSAAAPQGHVEE
jgi:hypothetical protein